MAEGNYGPEAIQPELPLGGQMPGPLEAIDKLVPGSTFHDEVKQKVLDRIQMSERKMSQFYARWSINEKKMQAYIDLPKYEKQLQDMSQKGEPPQLVSVVIPYSYATIWTIVTYMVHTFCGSKPIFPVSSYKGETVKAAGYMETVLQYNADHTRIISALFQFFMDAEMYGVSILRPLWQEEWGMRTEWTEQSLTGLLLPGTARQKTRQRVKKKISEYNEVVNVDPFQFFPDPRVPMNQVAKRGEFVFWRSFEGKHFLEKRQAEGIYKHIEHVGSLPSGQNYGDGSSARALLSQGDPTPGDPRLRDHRAEPFAQIDQGTIEIIPSLWGLGEENEPTKWLFTIVNKKQIVQAEPLDYDHGEHPVVVSEPGTFGYGFGQPGTIDFLGPIQDSISWFMNSHIYNVRTALNNMFVVDPSMIEMQDLKNPAPGKHIRLKRSAFGQDVRMALQQLQVQDVTQNHLESIQGFMRIGDALSSVNDNLKGIQQSGGRKTATEIRTSGEAGASRLAARARYSSAQGISPLTNQMSLNIQQFMSMDFYLAIVGKDAAADPVQITPEMVTGDFYYPVSDGTLPIDKMALVEVWKEIWMAVATNQTLAVTYDGMGIFEYLAQLAGAKNLSQFKIQAQPDAMVAAGAQNGNLAPVGPGGPAAQIPGGGALPGTREGYAGNPVNGGNRPRVNGGA